jgi:DNA-binding response OmpR family regulator
MSEPVMVIDASAVSRLIVEIALRRQSIACGCFADGTQALRALETNPQFAPQVIVMELAFNAPAIDGITLIRLLRSSPGLDETAIVVFTARSGMISRLRARLAGANVYLVKPFNRDTFLEVILPLLRERPGLDEQPNQSVREQHAPGGEHLESSNVQHSGPTSRVQRAS